MEWDQILRKILKQNPINPTNELLQNAIGETSVFVGKIFVFNRITRAIIRKNSVHFFNYNYRELCLS